ncbi:MAG: hypothetical protein JSU63_07060, partial [Phycisphaerales bacterium]
GLVPTIHDVLRGETRRTHRRGRGGQDVNEAPKHRAVERLTLELDATNARIPAKEAVSRAIRFLTRIYGVKVEVSDTAVEGRS